VGYETLDSTPYIIQNGLSLKLAVQYVVGKTHYENYTVRIVPGIGYSIIEKKVGSA
jgi:hypothetical protein